MVQSAEKQHHYSPQAIPDAYKRNNTEKKGRLSFMGKTNNRPGVQIARPHSQS